MAAGIAVVIRANKAKTPPRLMQCRAVMTDGMSYKVPISVIRKVNKRSK